MPPRDFFVGTATGTFVVALVLCLACSLLVSSASQILKPIQEANAALDKKKNVLIAAKLIEADASADEIAATFEESVVKRLINLETGEALSEEQAAEAGIDPETYDSVKAASDADLQVAVEPEGALLGSTHREPFAEAYEILKDGQAEGYVLPIYGMGLWGKLYGFLSVEGDGETVRGITYYKHKETPGLGGEVDNPSWKKQWEGKQIYQPSGEVGLSVVKGGAPQGDAYGVDGLSGATITSKGVDNMVKYWLGPDAFGPYLAQNVAATD